MPATKNKGQTMGGAIIQQLKGDFRIAMTVGQDLSVDLTNIRTTNPNFPLNGATCVATTTVTRNTMNAISPNIKSTSFETPYTVQKTDDGTSFGFNYQK
jgi:hypothetical protein